MNKQIILLVASVCVLLLFVTTASANAVIGIGDCSGSVTLPIVVTGAENAGAVDVTLEYDPSVVIVTGVSGGGMDSMLANIEDNRIGMVRIAAYQSNSNGIDGTFIIANVELKPVGSAGRSCALVISVTTFKDSTPVSSSMEYTVRNGTYLVEYDGSNDRRNDGYGSGYKWYIHDANDSEVNVTDDEPSGNGTIAETPITSPTNNLTDEIPVVDITYSWTTFSIILALLFVVILYLIIRISREHK